MNRTKDWKTQVASGRWSDSFNQSYTGSMAAIEGRTMGEGGREIKKEKEKEKEKERDTERRREIIHTEGYMRRCVCNVQCISARVRKYSE